MRIDDSRLGAAMGSAAGVAVDKAEASTGRTRMSDISIPSR